MTSSRPIDECPMGIPVEHSPARAIVAAVTPSQRTTSDPGDGSLPQASGKPIPSRKPLSFSASVSSDPGSTVTSRGAMDSHP